MAVLVTHGANAIERRARDAHKLGAAGIGVNRNVIKVERAAIVGRVAKLPLVRPDGVLISAVDSLAKAGIGDVDVLYLAVAIPVIVMEIDLSVDELQSLSDHLARLYIVAIAVVSSIVSHVFTYSDRS